MVKISSENPLKRSTSMKFPRVRKAYKEAEAVLRRKPRVSVVYFLLRFLVILTIITQFFNRNYNFVTILFSVLRDVWGICGVPHSLLKFPKDCILAFSVIK